MDAFMIRDLPREARPRERLVENGVKSLSDAELLAIILRSGTFNENAITIATRLMKKYSLRLLASQRIHDLKSTPGIGDAKSCQIIAALELGRRAVVAKHKKRKKISTARDVAQLLIPEMSTLKKEYFKGIFLDTRQRLIKEETIFIGTLDSAIIHPREIFQPAFSEGAAALILAHNHPSGDPSPSDEDIEITKELQAAGAILGVEILDHIIIGNKGYISLKEKGHL